MSQNKQIRNIGIFAHVDAGKTTLTERILAQSGAIRSPGSVDTGTAHTDRLEVERRRGISVRSTAASVKWRDTDLFLIDTPGHADFASEVERSLWALDGAVLVLSAVDGVQPQAEVLFATLRRLSLPVLFFVNKTDREGADVPGVLAKARHMLSAPIVDAEDPEALQWLLAESDEQALADLLEGKQYPREQLLSFLRTQTHAGQAYPALSGSALQGTGVTELLDAMVDLLPPPQGDPQGPLSGVVFAVEQDRTLGRAAQVRLFSGTLRNRDVFSFPARANLPGDTGQVQVKVSQIRSIPLAGRGEDLGTLEAGEIGAVYGLGDIRIGQVLGEASLLPRRISLGEMAAPLLLVKATPKASEQQKQLRTALEALSVEDPLLAVEELGGESHLRVMGAIQLEILEEQLKNRYDCPVTFGAPSVIYRETIRKSAVGFYAYTMPKPCWAVIQFQIDPLPRGSGVHFASQVSSQQILPRYQHQIEQAIPLATRQGLLGWRVDDVQITLTGGEHHLVHTHPLDFIMTTPMAFLDGLRRGGSVLLEPVLEMRLTVPEDTAGRLLGEITQMRGTLQFSEVRGELMWMVAQVPAATSMDFSTRLAALTGGRGAMTVKLSGYQECDVSLGATCPRRGVSPLDTAKYILAARSALEGGVFDL